MKKTAALFSLIRPLNFLFTFCVIAVGYLISIESEYSLFILLCASFSGAFTLAAGNIVNDIFDTESDKINHPRRPLAANLISYNTAKIIWFIVTLLSFTLSSLISFYAFLAVLGIHILLIFYSYKLKSTLIAGNFLIAMLTGMAFLYGSFAAGNFDKIFIPFLFAFLINFIREMVKDIQDLRGDLINGIVTYPGKYGILYTKRIIFIFIILLMLLTLYPFISEYYKIEFFLLMMLVVNPLLVYVLKILFNMKKRNQYERISGILKFNMAVGLIAIYLGQ
jgi:geranylgeranylglycerol-phosphate geranylgeranyltransferase